MSSFFLLIKLKSKIVNSKLGFLCHDGGGWERLPGPLHDGDQRHRGWLRARGYGVVLPVLPPQHQPACDAALGLFLS